MTNPTVDTIAERLIALLRADATVRTATGATDADSRIYAYYEAEAYNKTVEEYLAGATDGPVAPAYVTMALLSMPRAGIGAVNHPVFSFAIWARNWADAITIRDRVEALFHKKQIAMSATVRDIYTKVTNENDSAQVQPDFRGRTLHVRAGYFENP